MVAIEDYYGKSLKNYKAIYKKKETNLEAIALSNNEMEERGVSNKRAVEHRICPWEGKNQRFYLDSFSKKKRMLLLRHSMQ